MDMKPSDHGDPIDPNATNEHPARVIGMSPELAAGYEGEEQPADIYAAIDQALADNGLKPEDFAAPPEVVIPKRQPRYAHVSVRVGVQDGNYVKTKGRTYKAPGIDLFDTKHSKLSKRQARKLRKSTQRALREPLKLQFA